jgi:hypothetical protein
MDRIAVIAGGISAAKDDWNGVGELALDTVAKPMHDRQRQHLTHNQWDMVNSRMSAQEPCQELLYSHYVPA